MSHPRSTICLYQTVTAIKWGLSINGGCVVMWKRQKSERFQSNAQQKKVNIKGKKREDELMWSAVSFGKIAMRRWQMWIHSSLSSFSASRWIPSCPFKIIGLIFSIFLLGFIFELHSWIMYSFKISFLF